MQFFWVEYIKFTKRKIFEKYAKEEFAMIFITVGSQKFQFNRLLRKIDYLIENGTIKEEVFAQIGYSDYKPHNYTYQDFLDRKEFAAKVESADIVITHGGTGAIISAIKKEKKVIVVPRLVEYGEHVDDHQLQIVKQFKNLDFIFECLDVEKLEEALKNIRSVKNKKYQSNTTLIIENIIKFIEEEC